jgi:hypothetical protein
MTSAATIPIENLEGQTFVFSLNANPLRNGRLPLPDFRVLL